MIKPKVVWITGASSGIGRALFENYAQKGCKIIITSRNEEKLNALKANAPQPDKVFVLPFDITNYQLSGNIVQSAWQAFKSIDIVIFNAGISQRSLALETSIEVDKKLMEVNYLGTVALCKSLLPYFLKNNGGQIGVVSSLVGKFGSPMRSGYSASKHALHGFFDSLRAELTQKNITITLICPGYVRTDISIHALTGNGAAQNTMDEATAKGISAEKTALKIIKAISKHKSEIYIGKKEVLGVYLKMFFPFWFEKLIAKAKVT